MEWEYGRSISGVVSAEADADRATLPPALSAFLIRQMEPATEDPHAISHTHTPSTAVAASN